MVELGTNGFSTLFLADVARGVGAELVTVDTEEQRTRPGALLGSQPFAVVDNALSHADQVRDF